ncbi:transporter [Massilia eurypsychrophila]|uniref:Transporter n=1 Tax=Massilia eurypsychrophila TaxID=1485217 RepID=A0A2G8T9H2_9BURK|nr:VirB4 family type IV secretion system protein [Massilia eurypsychrophila]PIL42644.1 transporter [Massilia eurypsychrophila]
MSTSAISKPLSESELRSLPAIEAQLPKLRRHVTPRVVNYEDGRALLVIKLAGMPFESMDDAIIVNRFNSRNRLIAALAKDKGRRLSFSTTLDRKRVAFSSLFKFKSAFMRQFSEKYLSRFNTGKYFSNDFYISLILKHDDVEEGAAELEEVGNQLMKALNVYDPEYLETYVENGVMFSKTYEYLGFLVNGVWEKQPVLACPAAESIPSSWLHFGYETLEIRGEGVTRFATNYDLKDFPDDTVWGMFDKVLALPAEFTLTQSFMCMAVFEQQEALQSQINNLTAVGDAADHQIKDLQQAKGYIATGELAFGEYHCALTVYGDTKAEAVDNGTLVTGTFLGECGARFIRANQSAKFTYQSHVPGAKVKPRPMMKSSRNLAASFGMHNYSTGKAEGNPIGDGSALLPLQTTSSSLYSFNFHHSKKDEDNQGEKIAGSCLILGATGAGKTTLQTVTIGFLERFDAKIFALDKDEGLKIFIAALGGVYYSLKAGERTGLAPFQLPDTPKTRQFLYGLVKTCGKNDKGTVTDEEGNDIKAAVDAVLDLPWEHRRFSRMLENITDIGGNCLAQRLAKWCESRNGEFAWALDNVGDNIGVISEMRVGFDVSDFLVDNYQPTEPILAYLFHLKSLMQEKGGLLTTVISEFHIPAKYPTTYKMMFDVLKTGRKRDEHLVLDSQSPEDAIDSPIFAAIRDQTPTKIFLPNPSAEFASYERCGMTYKEFAALKDLELDSRTFLIKQGNQSCFAKLDLYGMDDEISVLSGNTENVAIFNEIVAEFGADPDVWLPIFQARRKGKRKKVADPVV